MRHDATLFVTSSAVRIGHRNGIDVLHCRGLVTGTTPGNPPRTIEIRTPRTPRIHSAMRVSSVSWFHRGNDTVVPKAGNRA
jgi:hypothetical protein